MADSFPPFAFTSQESWYGELTFRSAEDGSPISLAGRRFEMHITPALGGQQLVDPVRILTMDAGRGLSLKTGDASTIVFFVPRDTARAFPRGEFTGDVLEVVSGERYLFMPVRITYAEPAGLRAYLSRFLGVSVSFASRQQPIITPLAVPGREGKPGATIITGMVPPVPADGNNGDFYIEDRTASGFGRRMYGPKAGGAWPGTPWNIQVATVNEIPDLANLQADVTAKRAAVAADRAAISDDRTAVAGDRTATQAALVQAQNAVGYGRFVVDLRSALTGADALARPDGTIAEVINDPNPVTATAGNGTYLKVGAPGAGSYSKRLDLTLPALSTSVTAAAVALDILYSEIPSRVIPFRSFRLAGNASSGDAGSGALYVRGTNGPRRITDALGTSFVLALEGGVANIGHFGAIGDGVAKDHAAMTAALAASPQVYVPRGRFLFDDFFTIPATGATIIGAGRDLTKIVLGTAKSGLVNANLRSDVVIDGIYFIGRKDTPAGANLLAFSNSTRISVRRCRFEGTRHTAIAFGPATSASGLDDCQFYDCGYFVSTNDNAPAYLFYGNLSGDTIDQSQEKNNNNYIKNCLVRNGMSGTLSRQSKFTFADNDIISAGSAALYVSLTREYKISGGRISAPGPNGDTAQGGNGLDIINCANGQISNMEIYGCGAAAVMMAGNMANTQISNVKGYDNSSSPVSLHRGLICIDLSLSGTGHDGLTISGCQGFDTRAGSPSVTQVNAIGINGSVASIRNLKIASDNILRGYSAVTGEDAAVSVFQRPILPVTEFPQWFNMATGTTRDLTDAVVSGILNVGQWNNIAEALIRLRGAQLATPGQLIGSTLLTRTPAFNGATANFSTTNEVAFTLTLGDGTASTVRLNRTTLTGSVSDLTKVTTTEFINAITAQMSALSGKATVQLDAPGRLTFVTTATGTGTTALISLQNVAASSGNTLVDVGFGISTDTSRSYQGKNAVARVPARLGETVANYFEVGSTNSGTTFAVYTTAAGKHVLANNTGSTRLVEISLLAGSRLGV